ncbi:MAG: gliding motility-associated C-terminal domain-containing protein [Saprospirales bacterium]|nr:MAG: gliding motility-associated C-terminal domain-containing protein [Saprospirales bacterium]
MTLNLSIAPVLEGTEIVSICQGQSYHFHGTELNESGVYTEMLVTAEGCDSLVTLELTIEPAIEQSIAIEICQGSSLDFNGQILEEAGTYVAELSTAEGCDSIVTLHLSIAPALLGFKEVEICQGYEYDFHGQLLSLPGVYVAELTTAEGCDSIVSLELTVLPAIQSYVNKVICNGQEYDFFGTLLTSSGSYTHTTQTESGCDSVVNLQLTVLPAAEEHIFEIICQGQSFDFNGQIVNQSGQYMAELLNSEGCDSIVYLDLIVLPAIQSQINATICYGQTYHFNGENLSEAGTYVAELTTPDGCDSIVTLNLIVFPVKQSTKTVMLCLGGSFEYHGEVYTESSIHEILLVTDEGCDSIVTLEIRMLPPVEENIEAFICEGEEYLWHGQSLSSSGTYSITLTTPDGCDSIVNLNLYVQQTIEKEVYVQMCQGATYYFGSESITESGTYIGYFESLAGCDSIVTLNIDFLDIITTEKTVLICQGGTYTYNGVLLEQPGQYQFEFVTSHGCDSIVILNINTEIPPTVYKTASICQGTSYDFFGTILSEPGTYYAEKSSPGACDTIIALTLILTPPQESFMYEFICHGSSYDFHGLNLNQSGTYQTILTSSEGCDSIVNLHLTVLPAPVKVFNETVCQGGVFYYNGNYLSEEGPHLFQYTTQEGCDSLVIINLSFILPSQGSEIAYVCPGGSYNFYGEVLTEAGYYSTIISTPEGCDSIINLDLRYSNIVQNTVNAEVCEGGTYYFNGTHLSEPGTYTDTLQTVGGCDSLVVLILNFAPDIIRNIEVEICEGEEYDFFGQMLTESGTYSAEISNAEGCDSVVNLELTVIPLNHRELTIEICQGDTLYFNGNTFFQEGTYEELIISQDACDTLLSLSIIVKKTSETFQFVEICEGEFYVFGDHIISESGIYYDTLLNSFGCDSIVILEAYVHGTGVDTLNIKICEEDEFVFNGVVYDQPGVFWDTLQTGMGCDSVLVLEVSVISKYRTINEVTICAGESYYWNGEWFNRSGIYVENYLGAEGCDSLIRLDLTVLPDLVESIDLSICTGEVVEWNGRELFEAGVYLDTLSNFWGCDSLVVLNLSVNTVSELQIEQNICSGDSIWFMGSYLTEAGLYRDTLSGFYGCDSIISLDLKLWNSSVEYYEATICENETFEFNGVEFSESGIYSIHHSTMYGCDSVEIFELTVIPITRDTLIEEICEGDVFEFFGESYYETGNYLEVIEAEVGCNHEVLLELEVFENTFKVDLGEDITINLGEEVQLNAWINQLDEYIDYYYWTPPDWLNCTDCKRPLSSPLESITYWFEVIGLNGCRAIDSIKIEVEENINVYIPNIFTPNRDGVNDVLYIFADKDVRNIKEFKIFDRWGNKVFESYNFPPNDPYFGWDGTFKGQPMNPAVFAYYAVVELINGNRVLLKGDITLAR